MTNTFHWIAHETFVYKVGSKNWQDDNKLYKNHLLSYIDNSQQPVDIVFDSLTETLEGSTLSYYWEFTFSDIRCLLSLVPALESAITPTQLIVALGMTVSTDILNLVTDLLGILVAAGVAANENSSFYRGRNPETLNIQHVLDGCRPTPQRLACSLTASEWNSIYAK